MANPDFGSNLTNTTSKFSTATMDGKIRNVQLEINLIVTIIINSITCPFTVLLNVLVIMAVKRRPRLQTKANILLACLAVTDVLTGLLVQPSFIAWKISVLKNINISGIKELHNVLLRGLAVCSSLHLILVTSERLLAIKFTLRYLYIANIRNMKVSVLAIWAFSFITGGLRFMERYDVSNYAKNITLSLTLAVSVIFIATAYIILYRETLRHQKMIKTQQLPQEEVERFVKGNKALKTTVFVVGGVVLCFLPMVIRLWAEVLKRKKLLAVDKQLLDILNPWVRTFGMLNSPLNPLIYCLRQKEMRKFVFRLPSQVVQPHIN